MGWSLSTPTAGWKRRKRDDRRLRRWIGPTNTVYGTGWDKGHVIAHTMGGAVDGVEANVFIQRRDLNRGWSKEGLGYREMEKDCVAYRNVLLQPSRV